MNALFALLAAYEYVPFVKPLPLWQSWPLLILPLCLAIAIVYKSVRTDEMRRVPREAIVLFIFIIAVMLLAAGALMLLVNGVES